MRPTFSGEPLQKFLQRVIEISEREIPQLRYWYERPGIDDTPWPRVSISCRADRCPLFSIDAFTPEHLWFKELLG
jgi:hypothetical protein